MAESKLNFIQKNNLYEIIHNLSFFLTNHAKKEMS